MPAHALFDFLLGTVVGVVGGLFGVSGGVLVIPSLGFMGMTQQAAQGTSLVMQFPNVLIAMWQYVRRGRLDVRAALKMALPSIPFTIAGAVVAVHAPSAVLRVAFACFLMTMASYTLWNVLRRKRQALAAFPLTWPYLATVGAIGGVLSGLFGIGGASFATPSLVLFFGLPQTVAQGMALFLVMPGIAASLYAYGLAGDVNWPAGIVLGIGGALTVSLGVSIAHRLPERTLRLMFCTMLYTVAALLLIRR